MKHIISVGGGIASSLILPLWAMSHYPKCDIELVMARLPNEDPDVWRLCEAVEDITGLSVKFIGSNQTPWDVFFRVKIMGNTRVDPCSLHLKREVMREYITGHYAPGTCKIHVGIGAYEIDREIAIRKRWGAAGYETVMPLLDYPQMDRAWAMRYCKAMVGFVPRLYQMGFSHNNCAGACVKAGKREWARLLWFLPDVYEWWETNEEKFRAERGKDVSILRDELKTGTVPLSLRAFRQRMESRRAGMLPGFVGLVEGYAELEKQGVFDDLEDTPGCQFCDAVA